MADAATIAPPVSAVREASVQLEEYPYSDGRVLMEADPHANAIVAMRNQLQAHFKGLRDVYVAGSMAVYYRQGDSEAVVAPDLFVALGVERRERNSYKIWEEGGVLPAFVVEVASPSTARLDATSKKSTYEQMGVWEYWRFDPVRTRIPQGLVGWRLKDGRYRQVRATKLAGDERWYRSSVLNLGLRSDGRLLRFWDVLSGKDLRTHLETNEALDIAERRTEAVTAARRDAERRAEQAECRAQHAEHRAQHAERRAEADAAARRTAERERDEANQRLLELEARLRGHG